MLAALRGFAASLGSSGTALRNHAIRRVVLAFLVYNTVEMASWTTILVYAYAATGPASVGIVAVVQLLPSAVIAPLLAGIGDRYPRAQVLLGWFVVQAATLAAVGLTIIVGGPPVLVYAFSFLATVALTQTRPLVGSILPDLAHSPAELTAANALCSIATGLGGFIGPIATGILLATADPGLAFVVTAVVTLAGALLLVGVASHRHTDAVAAAPGAADEASDGGGDEDDAAPVLSPGALLAGLREVVHDADLAVVMLLSFGYLVIFGGLEVLLVLVSIELLGIGESGAGFLIGAMGFGLILGGAAAFGLAGRRRLAPYLGVAAVVIGLPVALIGVAPAPRSAAVLLVLTGIGCALLDTVSQTLLQRITPDAVRARVFGVLEGLLLIGEAVGSVIIAPLAAVFGLRGAAIALGLLLPVMAGLTMVRFARIDARVRIPTEELAALRVVPMFAPLGAAALESVARHLVRVPVAAGTPIIHQGDPGDRWYLIDRGRFTVRKDGVELDRLGPGDGFGEIALLRDVPRTATVIAVDDAVVWALEREPFLAGVTGSPQALLEAERVAAARSEAHAASS